MFWLVLLLPSHLKINANENAVTSRTTMASSNTLPYAFTPIFNMFQKLSAYLALNKLSANSKENILNFI